MNIKEILKRGETQTVEFKKSVGLMKEGCKALCGMLNTDVRGGHILFGIAPDGKVEGLKDDLDTIQRTLSQHIKQKFEPTIISSISVIELDEREIITLSAERPQNVPYYEYDGRAYIKEGSTKRQLSLYEKQSLLKARDRANHNGPWKCDKCGSWVNMLSSVVLTNEGPKKSYKCQCGGEFWPAD